MAMTAKEWLVLSRLPGLGARRIASLKVRQPEWPDGWLALLPGPARDALRLWLEHPSRSPLQAEVERALDWASRDAAHHLLTPSHPAWPALLDELPDPPQAVSNISALPTIHLRGESKDDE